MKTVQVLFDEDLLAELDDTAEVRERGRSAVLRELTGDFLRQRRKQEIDAQTSAPTRAWEIHSARTSKGGLKHDSVVNLDQVQTVDQNRLHPSGLRRWRSLPSPSDRHGLWRLTPPLSHRFRAALRAISRR
jgi:hypothetical protein